jgi:hypothetical protein
MNHALTYLNKYRFHSTSIAYGSMILISQNPRVASLSPMITCLTLKMNSYLLNWYTYLIHILMHDMNQGNSWPTWLDLFLFFRNTNLSLHIIPFGYLLSVNTFWILHTFRYHHSCIHNQFIYGNTRLFSSYLGRDTYFKLLP